MTQNDENKSTTDSTPELERRYPKLTQEEKEDLCRKIKMIQDYQREMGLDIEAPEE